MKKKRNERARLIGLYVLYAVLTLAPAAVVIALDWDVYTATPQRAVSLSLCGAAALVAMIMHALGKSPKPMKRVVRYAAVAAVLWVLRPIIDNLALLATAVAAGEALGLPVMSAIGRCKARIQQAAMADAVSEGVRSACGGRV